MATLDPNIIKDTKTLISLYQRNLSFRTAFDRIVKRNINATYQGRPIKLYVEVLSRISTRYRLDYKQVRKIVLHDKEGKVGELFKKVRPYDFYLLDSATRAAQQGLNNTSYSAQDIEQINNIEKTTKDRKQKGVAYTKRIDEITKVEKQAAEQSIPGSSPEHKKSYQPASPEEKARLDAAVNKPLPQVSKDTLVGVDGKPLIKQPSTPGKTSSPSRSTPNLSGNRSWSARIRGFFRGGVSSTTEKVGVTTVTEGVVTRFGTRFAAGRAITAGAGKLVARFGVGTAVKAGVGILAKLGVSLVAGIATGGVGLVVGVAVMIITTFPGLVKKLFRIIFWAVVGFSAFVVFMFIFRWGIKMNSLLSPYSVGFAEPLPSTSPTPSGSITPTPTPTGCSSGNYATCIKDTFGITMIGFSQHSLELAWQKFSAIDASTKFISLVRGSVVQAIDSGSSQVGCPGDSAVDVYLQQFSGDDDLFNVILIHELGHAVRNCNSRTAIMYDQHLQVLASEGPITSYAANASCTGSDTFSEDYAEMVTYYLNINSPSRTAACAPDSQGNPYSGGRHPAHYQLVQQILKK